MSLRFVPNPNIPIPTRERRYGRTFEITPIRSYDRGKDADWVEDMEMYVDVEPAVPPEAASRKRRVPSATEEAMNLLEATDYATKMQYADRVIGRTILPSLTRGEKIYSEIDSIASRAEKVPSVEGFVADYGMGADSTDSTLVVAPTLDITLPPTTKPVAAASSASTLYLIGGLALGGYVLYKLFGSNEYPRHKLPRYAGGKRRL